MARVIVLLLLAFWSAVAVASDALETPRLFTRGPTGTLIAPLAQLPFDDASSDDPSLVWVVLPIRAAPVRFLVGATGVRDTNHLQPLLYESRDCGGAPLIAAPSEPGGILDPIVLAGTVYWSEGVGTPRTVRSEGWLVLDPDQCEATLLPGDLCCVNLRTPDARVATPAAAIGLTSLELTTSP
jgi:hypothetical protein